MLNGIRMEKYRGFEDYRVNDFTSVNLIVGKNNCGKSSLLEAIQLLVSGGDLDVLKSISRSRGEIAEFSDGAGRKSKEFSADFSHLFMDHDFHLGASVQLSDQESQRSLQLEVIPRDDRDTQQSLFDNDLDSDYGYALSCTINGPKRSVWPVSRDGVLMPTGNGYRVVFARERPAFSNDLLLVTPESLGVSAMSRMWDKAVIEGTEEAAIHALQVLEPDLADIVFLSGDRPSRERTGIFLGFRNRKRRLPMGSFGEGMRRLLALSLSLASVWGGTLLIDEIDTGLHWSIMRDMWQLVVYTAINTNTQLFVTSHSLDCLRGLVEFQELDPRASEHVAVHKIDRDLETAVRFDSSEIKTAIEQEIEVR